MDASNRFAGLPMLCVRVPSSHRIDPGLAG
jgi:hypothetical protein